ncbi:hypothetical protein EJ110_NYTH10961 [Nymphaea thermarum]|nr:hypothetical protein EJ110_NYTH10961 [Nymphaea thermarum]
MSPLTAVLTLAPPEHMDRTMLFRLGAALLTSHRSPPPPGLYRLPVNSPFLLVTWPLLVLLLRRFHPGLFGPLVPLPVPLLLLGFSLLVTSILSATAPSFVYCWVTLLQDRTPAPDDPEPSTPSPSPPPLPPSPLPFLFSTLVLPFSSISYMSMVLINVDEGGIGQVTRRKDAHDNVKAYDEANNGPLQRAKLHQCPMCLKVFASGQALGGHKRSHLFRNGDTEFGENACRPVGIP